MVINHVITINHKLILDNLDPQKNLFFCFFYHSRQMTRSGIAKAVSLTHAAIYVRARSRLTRRPLAGDSRPDNVKIKI